MFAHRTRIMYTLKKAPQKSLALCLLCCLLLVTCSQSSQAPVPSTPTAARPTATPAMLSPTPTATTLPDTTPTHYTSQTILSGVGRPDDLVFDQQGRLLFSDFYNGTISRVNANGTATILMSGLAGPEGLIVLPDGQIIIAEQRTNRILTLASGAQMPTVLRALPGTPSTAQCKDGIDGIALDPTTNTIIVPDSPTGDVYRLSLDGKTLTLLASGIVRPVGAAVDAHGTIYIADECGGALWRIPATGKKTPVILGGFRMPDDVVLDAHGNLLVTDLASSVHALIRVRLPSGKHETLASQGFIEPQGLVVDEHDNIFISDDYANIIVEYRPA